MTNDLIDLGRRAVACKRWRWMPGMHDYRGWLVIRTFMGRIVEVVDPSPTTPTGQAPREPYPDPLPDLSDPATLGCLLALVMDADPGSVEIWISDDICHFDMFTGDTLVAALEAAPEPR